MAAHYHGFGIIRGREKCSIVVYYARVRALHAASMNTSVNRLFVSVVKQPSCTIDMSHNNINTTIISLCFSVVWSAKRFSPGTHPLHHVHCSNEQYFSEAWCWVSYIMPMTYKYMCHLIPSFMVIKSDR